MTTKEEQFNEIDRRVHLKENAERYHQLVAHPEEISGGKEFLKNSKMAKNLLDTIEKNTDPRLNHKAQYRHLIQYMTNWMNENGWA